jgi:tetratricopeptide (TPR) repeat protein
MFNRKSLGSIDSLPKATFFVACLLLFSGWWVYQPGLTGPLLLDDWANLGALENNPVNDWGSFRSFIFGNTSGPTGRPVSMLSFLMDGQSWPIEAATLKHTNILIHLLCGLSVLLFAICVFRSLRVSHKKVYLLALLSSSIWLLHPLNVSTVLYVIQRMTQLVTLFSLLGLICFFVGRELVLRNSAKGLLVLTLALCPFSLLAIFAKENGVLLLASFFIIELTLFQKLEVNTAYKRWFVFAVILPLILVVVYLGVTFNSSLTDYSYRPYSMLERLLTESRILIVYLANIFLPQISGFGLYHDDIAISTSLWNPITTLFSVACILLLLLSAVVLRSRAPMFSFAVLWFFVWHFLESTYLPLELYFEHRNYIPMLGPIFALSYYLLRLSDLFSWKYTFKVAITLAVIGILFLGSLTYQLTRLWSGSGVLISHWAEQHPNSRRAQSDLAIILADIGFANEGLVRLQSLSGRYPDDINLLLQIFNYGCSYDQEVSVSLQQITTAENLELFQDDVNVHIRKIIDNLKQGVCPYPAQYEVLGFMERVAALEMNARTRVVFNILYSELFVHYGLIDEALLKLDYAFEIEPSVDIAIRQSTLAGSVARFDQALEILNKAYLADEQKKFLLPSRRDEIDDWRIQIEALL